MQGRMRQPHMWLRNRSLRLLAADASQGNVERMFDGPANQINKESDAE